MLRTDITDKYIRITNGSNVMWSFDIRKSYISVGAGRADYKMKRGSFHFKEKTVLRIKLFVSNTVVASNGFSATLCDSRGKELYALKVSYEAAQIRLSFTPLTELSCNRLQLTIPATKEEHIYGCGETFTKFDLRGERVRIWVAEHQNAGRITKKIIRQTLLGVDPQHKGRFSSYETYYAQPTFVSSRKYFLHVDSSADMTFDFSDKKAHVLTINDICDVIVGYSPDFEKLMTNLTSLLGRQPTLPSWVYDGAILGIQGGTATLERKLKACKKANMKIAGVWCQDWEGRRVTSFGSQLMWNWEWDRELYPGLDKEIVKLKNEGIRFLGYVNTFLAVEKELYSYASEHGYCVKNKQGEDYLVTITTFPAAIVDLTNPNAYNWLKEVIKRNMIDFGLDGWMADFGEYLPTDCVLASGEDAKLVHNRWPAMWAKLNREAVEESGKLGEIFFFTRAGHTQTVRYSTLMWNGDQHVDWSVDDGLPSVIPATLSLAMCGFGLCHSDAGGYTTYKKRIHREPELLMRWAELCTFSPVFRSHEGNQPENNVHFDSTPEILSHYSKMSRIHFALKPYLQILDKQNSTMGIPVIRPLFFYYHDDKAYTQCSEYLLGRDMLIAPILKNGQRARSVYLPDDRWVLLWNGREYGKGTHNVFAPVGQPPVFIRKDSDYFDTLMNITQ